MNLFLKQRGFTIIELLVVLAIIGFLTTIIFGGLNSARAKSRDARRLGDLVQVRTALETYAANNDGAYPANVCTQAVGGYCQAIGDIPTLWIGTSPNCLEYSYIKSGLAVLVEEGYLSAVPVDPKPTTTYCYQYYGIPNEAGDRIIGYKFRVMGTIETFDTLSPTRHSLRDMSADAFCRGGLGDAATGAASRKSLAISAPPNMNPANGTVAECY